MPREHYTPSHQLVFLRNVGRSQVKTFIFLWTKENTKCFYLDDSSFVWLTVWNGLICENFSLKFFGWWSLQRVELLAIFWKNWLLPFQDIILSLKVILYGIKKSPRKIKLHCYQTFCIFKVIYIFMFKSCSLIPTLNLIDFAGL